MGLLSRFGRGLTEAAPIFGQMAQASLLQAAEDKKYNRLIDREEKTWERKMEFETGKATAALTSARRKEKIQMLSDGLSLTASLREVQERSLASYREQLSDISLTGASRAAVQGLYDTAEKRLVETIRRQNEISDMYQKYVDPTGEIPWGDTSAEKNILTDLAVMNAASIAKDEIMGAEAMATEEFDIDTDMLTDVQRATNLENKDSIIETQLKTIDESISGRAEPLNDKQKKLFKDTVESYIADRSYLLPGDQPRTEIDRRPEGAEVVEIIEPREGLRAATPEDLKAITASYGALDPEVLSIFGRWLGKAGSWTVEQFKSIPVAEILEFLSRADRAKLEGMGIDPDATPVGFGESSMRTGDKPAVEDAIAMMFNMPQRV